MITKKWFIIFALIALSSFQLIYGFLYPSVGFDGNWQPLSIYLPKFSVEKSDSFLLGMALPLISSGYRLNSDVSHYLELGRDFSASFLRKDPIFMERPLYSFLIYLVSLPLRPLVEPSFGIIFAIAILINFILISSGVLLFFLLVKELFSLRIAWLSAILLIFSPFVHSNLSQPMADILTVFMVILSSYLLFNYANKPSALKLISFSLVIGALMLGKMFFAISIFILLLAICIKRWKEGIIFFAVHFIPLLLWYLLVTKIWQLNYYSLTVQHFNYGTWMFDMINWPWYKIYKVLFDVLPDFITTLAKSFLLVPIIFSAIGFSLVPLKAKNIVYFGAFFAVLATGFSMGFYFPRHLFLLFPIIYPTCVLGIVKTADYLGKFKPWLSTAFYVIIFMLIIITSSINIYQVFDYR